jgi:hypothetical protein
MPYPQEAHAMACHPRMPELACAEVMSWEGTP